MKSLKILVLPGDGIGPEIVESLKKIIFFIDDSFKINFKLKTLDIGFKSLEEQGTTLPPNVLKMARNSDGVILGPVSHLDYPMPENGGVNPSGEIVTKLDLYANLRPAKSRKGIPTKNGKSINLLIVRQRTEGFYPDRNMYLGSGEYMPTVDMALSTRKITRFESERIAKVAFEQAAIRNKKVTAVHKANVFRISDGLFLDSVRNISKDYPDVDYNEELVDATAANLIRNSDDYDVIVTTNMFGDILSDEASEISGSLGIAPGINFGEKLIVAQAQHGSAPDIAGKNIANPSSLILSFSMMLSWIGYKKKNNSLINCSQLIDKSLDSILSDINLRTKDLGGKLSTNEFTKNLISVISNNINK
ncbi:MAG: 3-isopropylmalate dehydrogenase [Chloroflexi bacterium]|nr:3-isopropylmalate dehydrogenase [Chloroflexota bacterium]|tara:strand:+ start:993 stop:2078 length:1086 start_codon:yes stop_codon:yes gene_type:complete